MKLLAVGDLHLGRRPPRLPGALQERAHEFGPAGAWRRTVDAACAERVDAVVLAGDVVEREDDFFGAYRELQRGVARLAAAGVAVLGVAGNHDVQVLPRLADELPGFRLLGRDGRWESVTVARGDERLALWGWSFPRPRVTASPLAGAALARHPGTVTLGLLHCDRDQPGSSYAPVNRRELDAAGLDGWLLGHIHRPDALAVPSPAGYLGSLAGLDPGEPGAHGPWLIEVAAGRVRAVEQWTLAPLRWERLEIDLTGIAAAEDARVRLLAALRELDAGLAESRRTPDAVGLRVTLAGRTRFGAAALALFTEEERAELFHGAQATHYFVETLEAATRPEISLAALAERADPAGLLARRLLLLDAPDEDARRRALLAEARRRLEETARDPRWDGARELPPDDDETADWLRRAGSRLLERLLAQRDEEEAQ